LKMEGSSDRFTRKRKLDLTRKEKEKARKKLDACMCLRLESQ
jgi:hypothetical protein